MVTSPGSPLSPRPGPSVLPGSQSRLPCVGSIKEPSDTWTENIVHPAANREGRACRHTSTGLTARGVERRQEPLRRDRRSVRFRMSAASPSSPLGVSSTFGTAVHDAFEQIEWLAPAANPKKPAKEDNNLTLDLFDTNETGGTNSASPAESDIPSPALATPRTPSMSGRAAWAGRTGNARGRR